MKKMARVSLWETREGRILAYTPAGGGMYFDITQWCSSQNRADTEKKLGDIRKHIQRASKMAGEKIYPGHPVTNGFNPDRPRLLMMWDEKGAELTCAPEHKPKDAARALLVALGLPA